MRLLLDDQCAGHVRVTFASADIEIGSCWRSHDNSKGLSRSNHNAGSTGRFRSLFRQRGLGGIHEDRAVELVHFPAGVVHGEGERSRCSNPHKVRRKSEVFCGEGHGLHRPVTGEEGDDDEAEDRDPTVHRQDRTELTRTQTPASIQESPRPFNWLSQPVFNDRQQGAGSPSCCSIYRFLLSFPTADRGLRLFFVDDLEAVLEQFRLKAKDLGSDTSEKVT